MLIYHRVIITRIGFHCWRIRLPKGKPHVLENCTAKKNLHCWRIRLPKGKPHVLERIAQQQKSSFPFNPTVAWLIPNVDFPVAISGCDIVISIVLVLKYIMSIGHNWYIYYHILVATTICRSCSWQSSLVLYLVGGLPTPLKNMKVSWDDYSQYMEK